MRNDSVYAICDGERDLSRWIAILPIGGDQCIVRLQDLTHPGMPSTLKSLQCSVQILRDILHDGFVQVKTEEGYCQFQAAGEFVEITFRGNSDRQITRCDVGRQDFAEALEEASKVSNGAGVY